jgi:hypothetical protein
VRDRASGRTTRLGDGGEGKVGVAGTFRFSVRSAKGREVERRQYRLKRPATLVIVMSDKPKTAFDLAMERLNAEDREAGTKKEAPLSAKQKDAIAEARRVASSRLAEREILFNDSMKKTPDPEMRAKAEAEYLVDRQRINDDCEKAIEGIRRGKS